jgi:hypothetical protein
MEVERVREAGRLEREELEISCAEEVKTLVDRQERVLKELRGDLAKAQSDGAAAVGRAEADGRASVERVMRERVAERVRLEGEVEEERERGRAAAAEHANKVCQPQHPELDLV